MRNKPEYLVRHSSSTQATAPEARPRADELDEAELDRDQDMLQQACLPVSGAPLPPSDEPPKDADEYLRQVQWERMHVPDVMDVEVVEKPPRRRRRQGADRTTSLLAQFDAPEVPQELSFCSEWADDVAEAFQQMRSRCKETRRLSTTPAAAHLAADAWRELCAQERPSTALLAVQDFVSINHLIVSVVGAILEIHESVEGGDAASAGADAAGPLGGQELELPERAQMLTERLELLAEWAFAALAFVDVPLVDEIQYQLQRLRRACQKLILAEQGGAAPSGDGHGVGAPPCSPFRARANLLLVVVTRVFGQR